VVGGIVFLLSVKLRAIRKRTFSAPGAEFISENKGGTTSCFNEARKGDGPLVSGGVRGGFQEGSSGRTRAYKEVLIREKEVTKQVPPEKKVDQRGVLNRRLYSGVSCKRIGEVVGPSAGIKNAWREPAERR